MLQIVAQARDFVVIGFPVAPVRMELLECRVVGLLPLVDDFQHEFLVHHVFRSSVRGLHFHNFPASG
ncbi:hypothetical protein L596_026435 [Steinernema carpocapsae]|uniref:Uncharacterized protein n=1 Tax=Steinernema carpocapsae TaxID=34508 RepID=A0A4U5M2C6_STECR|nr:hypothetical protein L596_026435 [Steinernema carpocapsae]